ncbi:type II toxin-antitoxin system VapC family toxin [Inquilinus sp. Marseille-Q2685]|uniref:type II toxin-antitoxin system VapC family toxin n=1 Tax=Inquilinus sp. Marseille-Q2685 TaxID=2866581 RepID=UPI001CE402E9|nr:type II toxin-antitoxin system VapC family toxin [Inquilinus sp. Marseille-Q2685]
MKIIADTNLLIRVATRDDPAQAALAEASLREAHSVAVTTVTLCEFAWVLTRTYKKPSSDVSRAIRQLLTISSVTVDRPAVDAGLAILETGGDFADGVIAFEGRRLGGEVFVTFDRKAAATIDSTGTTALLLSEA